MVKPYTGYNEDGTPQSQEEYLGPSSGCLPMLVGCVFSCLLIAIVMFYVHSL